MVQQLRLPAPSVGGPGSIPGQGTRSHMHQLTVHVPQLKISRAATKDPACLNGDWRFHKLQLTPSTTIYINQQFKSKKKLKRLGTSGIRKEACHMKDDGQRSLWEDNKYFKSNLVNSSARTKAVVAFLFTVSLFSFCLQYLGQLKKQNDWMGGRGRKMRSGLAYSTQEQSRITLAMESRWKRALASPCSSFGM